MTEVPKPHAVPRRVAKEKPHGPVWKMYKDKAGNKIGPVVHGGQVLYSTSSTPSMKLPEEAP